MQTKLTTKQLEDAIWDYLLEHSDVTHNGTLFIKFHATTKTKFLGHVINRANGYHREDPNTKYIEALQKQKIHKDKCVAGISSKKTKKVKKSKCVTHINPKVVKLNGVYNRAPKIIKPIIDFYGKNILKIW